MAANAGDAANDAANTGLAYDTSFFDTERNRIEHAYTALSKRLLNDSLERAKYYAGEVMGASMLHRASGDPASEAFRSEAARIARCHRRIGPLCRRGLANADFLRFLQSKDASIVRAEYSIRYFKSSQGQLPCNI
jgi:hypothetical protein